MSVRPTVLTSMAGGDYGGAVLFQPVTTVFSFDHDGNKLAGDLVRPPWPGPYPAVVFVEGSGPGGRDQGLWPTRLAAAGFASLAYDKPGSGASTGDWTRQSIADRAEEAVAAVRALRSRGGVLPDAVALIGGSQGGWVAQLAPSLDTTIAAVVSVSGPGVSVQAQEEYRLSHQLPAEGFTGTDVRQALAVMSEQVDRVRAGEDPARVHTSQAHWHDAPWYPMLAGTTPQSIAFLAGIADYDPITALAALPCPLLAIFGADDLLVPVEDSVRVITATLKSAHHIKHEIMVFPHADHNIRIYTGRGPAKISRGQYTPGERAPGFDELIVTWLQRHLQIEPPRPRQATR
jgi:pimeloyl-ACP methyl ester carboxylesterase